MNSQLIESNYALKVSDIRLLDKHFGTQFCCGRKECNIFLAKINCRITVTVKDYGEFVQIKN